MHKTIGLDGAEFSKAEKKERLKSNRLNGLTKVNILIA